MTSHDSSQTSRTRARRFVRRAVTVLTLALAGLALAPAAAMADTPENWQKVDDPSGLDFLLVLFLIPAGLFVVITVLAALPSMIGDKGYEPGQTWRSQPEWFGGASKGVEAADDVTPAQIESKDGDRGGTSGAW